MTAKAAIPMRAHSKERSHASLANCACESGPGGRKAAGVDPELKDANQRRLRRIEGQIRGLQKMVEREKRKDRSHVRRTARTDLRASAITPPGQEEITQ